MTGKRELTATTDARRLLELAAISVRCAFAQRFMSLWLGERFDKFDILAGSTVVLIGLCSTRRCLSRSDMSSLSKVDHMRDLLEPVCSVLSRWVGNAIALHQAGWQTWTIVDRIETAE